MCLEPRERERWEREREMRWERDEREMRWERDEREMRERWERDEREREMRERERWERERDERETETERQRDRERERGRGGEREREIVSNCCWSAEDHEITICQIWLDAAHPGTHRCDRGCGHIVIAMRKLASTKKAWDVATHPQKKITFAKFMGPKKNKKSITLQDWCIIWIICVIICVSLLFGRPGGRPEAARRPGPGAILRSHLQDPRRQWSFHPWRSSAALEPWRRMPNLSGITAERSSSGLWMVIPKGNMVIHSFLSQVVFPWNEQTTWVSHIIDKWGSQLELSMGQESKLDSPKHQKLDSWLILTTNTTVVSNPFHHS